MRERGFIAGNAARLAGVKYRTLDYWSRSGFLEASLAEAAGKGTRRFYSFADVVSLRVAVKLRRFGVSLQVLRKVQERLRTYRGLENPLAEARLVVLVRRQALDRTAPAALAGARVDVARVEIAEGARLESVLLGPTLAAAVVLDLAPVVRDVREQLAKLDTEQASRRARRPARAQARKVRAEENKVDV